jgi:hypothetical protein
VQPDLPILAAEIIAAIPLLVLLRRGRRAGNAGNAFTAEARSDAEHDSRSSNARA